MFCYINYYKINSFHSLFTHTYALLSFGYGIGASHLKLLFKVQSLKGFGEIKTLFDSSQVSPIPAYLLLEFEL